MVDRRKVELSGRIIKSGGSNEEITVYGVADRGDSEGPFNPPQPVFQCWFFEAGEFSMALYTGQANGHREIPISLIRKILFAFFLMPLQGWFR